MKGAYFSGTLNPPYEGKGFLNAGIIGLDHSQLALPNGIDDSISGHSRGYRHFHCGRGEAEEKP